MNRANATCLVSPDSTRKVLKDLGARADRGRLERRISRLALGVATCAIMVAMGVLSITVSTYEGRIERDYGRTVPGDFAGNEDDGEALTRTVFDEVDEKWVVVVIAQPGPGTPPPPGVSRWPDPGSVLLSPALSGTEAGRTLVTRYGTREAAGIGPEGLVSPNERYAIVVPAVGTMASGANYQLDHFGGVGAVSPWANGISGGALFQRPLAAVLVGLSVGLLLPAGVLLTVAARAGASRRDRRLAVLYALGASPPQIRAVLTGEFLPPIILGGIAALTLMSTTMLVNIPLPYVHFTLRADDVRGSWLLTATVMLAAFLACIVIPIMLNRPRRAIGTRPAPRTPRTRLLGIAWMPLATVAMARTFTWSLQFEDSWVRIFILYLGLALIAVTIPSFIRTATHLLSRALVRIAHHGRLPGLLISARTNLADPASTARLGTGIAIVIILAAHVMVLATVTTPGSRAARAIQSEVGTSVLELNLPDESERSRAALTEVLVDQDAGLIAYHALDPIDNPGSYEMRAQCDTFAHLDLPCRDVSIAGRDLRDDRLRVVADLLSATTITVRVVPDDAATTTADGDDLTFIVAKHGQQLPVEAMRSSLAHRTIPAPSVSPVLQNWLVGLSDSQDKARWNVLIAAIAATVFAVALTTAAITDSGVLSARSGVIAIWAPAWPTLLALAAGRTLPPLLVAILAGNGVAYLTTLPFTSAPLNGTIPATYPFITVAAPLCVTVVMVGISATMQQRSLSRWRPGTSQ